MLNKKIYIKAIGISEIDLEYIKKLKETKIGNKKSLAGVLSYIINKHKQNDTTRISSEYSREELEKFMSNLS
jgi:hypothetical protein